LHQVFRYRIWLFGWRCALGAADGAMAGDLRSIDGHSDLSDCRVRSDGSAQFVSLGRWPTPFVDEGDLQVVEDFVIDVVTGDEGAHRQFGAVAEAREMPNRLCALAIRSAAIATLTHKTALSDICPGTHLAGYRTVCCQSRHDDEDEDTRQPLCHNLHHRLRCLERGADDDDDEVGVD
jgi:hypothetical protein